MARDRHFDTFEQLAAFVEDMHDNSISLQNELLEEDLPYAMARPIDGVQDRFCAMVPAVEGGYKVKVTISTKDKADALKRVTALAKSRGKNVKAIKNALNNFKNDHPELTPGAGAMNSTIDGDPIEEEFMAPEW